MLIDVKIVVKMVHPGMHRGGPGRVGWLLDRNRLGGGGRGVIASLERARKRFPHIGTDGPRLVDFEEDKFHQDQPKKILETGSQVPPRSIRLP